MIAMSVAETSSSGMWVLTRNNSLWSVIYPISTDMFMACTVKYTKLLICISVFSEGKIKLSFCKTINELKYI